MKKDLILLLTFYLLFAGTDKTHSQEVYSRLDSTVTYIFAEGSDSVRSKKRVETRVDSVLSYIKQTDYVWDADLDEWALSNVFDIVKDAEGNILFIDCHSWDPYTGEWYLYETEELEYDADGNLVRDEAYYRERSEGPWLGVVNWTYEYDSAGNRSREYNPFWDMGNGEWVPGGRTDYSYDTSGRKISRSKYRWKGMDDFWELYDTIRYDHIEDLEGRIFSTTTWQWNIEAALWVRVTMHTYAYNESGLMAEDIYYTPVYTVENDKWHAETKRNYDYDANGNRILDISFKNIAELTETEWEGYGNRIITTYTPDGRMILSKTYYWDEAISDWHFASSIEYVYDAYGYRITWINSVAADGGPDSKVVEKRFFSRGSEYYTSYDSICEGAVSEWRGQSLGIAGTYVDEYTSVTGADSCYKLILSYLPKPGSFQIAGEEQVGNGQTVNYLVPENNEVDYRWNVENGTILSGEQNDTLEVVWEATGTGEVAAWALNAYGCSSDTAVMLVLIGPNSVNESPDSRILLYPVPVKDILRIQSGLGDLQIEVDDLSGRAIVSARGTSIDLSHLSDGIYIVRLRDSEGVPVGFRRILKQ